MLRKLCKLALLPGLLALGIGAAWGQASAPVTATAADPVAAIWATTAEYVIQNDSALARAAPELVTTLRRGSLKAFEQSLNKAVELEAATYRKPAANTRTYFFETRVYNPLKTQFQRPAALVVAIADKLLENHPERRGTGAGAPQFREFVRSLNQLAGVPAAPAAAESAAAAPAGIDQAPPLADTLAAASAPVVVAPVPPATPSNWLTWLALALSGLSLATVAVLWNKLSNTRHKLSHLQHKWESSSHKNVDGEGFQAAKLKTAVEREVSRQIEQYRAARQAQATAAPAPTEPAPAPVAAPPAAPSPGPRPRIQYVSEAPFNNNFPARALSDQPGSYSMFAIESSEQQPDQGTFVVTGNLASHVRDHRSVLEPVCEYVGGYPSGSETRVVTVQPGQVRRRGADWEVVQRAQVRFE